MIPEKINYDYENINKFIKLSIMGTGKYYAIPLFLLLYQHVHVVTYKATTISVRVCEIITQQKQK